jgi:hypothetical protein
MAMTKKDYITKILDGLQQCTMPQRDLFKRMYPCNNKYASIQEHIDNIPTIKFPLVWTQIQNTLEKNQTRLRAISNTTIEQSPVQAPPSTRKTYTINTRDNSIVRLYTHEVVDENHNVVYEGISYDKCMSYIELEQLQQ